MLEDLKLILGITDNSKDILLNLYLGKSENKFLNYCNRSDVPTTATISIVDYAVILYNRRGSEGLSSESYSGINQSFEVGIPSDIKAEWNSFRKARFI